MLLKLIRLFRYKLVIPILRSQSPPVETARGVLVGLVSAMNPFVGIQMALVGGVARRDVEVGEVCQVEAVVMWDA